MHFILHFILALFDAALFQTSHGKCDFHCTVPKSDMMVKCNLTALTLCLNAKKMCYSFPSSSSSSSGRCNCHPLGSTNGHCEIQTGQCECQPGITGQRCERCEANHFGFGPEGCKRKQGGRERGFSFPSFSLTFVYHHVFFSVENVFRCSPLLVCLWTWTPQEALCVTLPIFFFCLSASCMLCEFQVY